MSYSADVEKGDLPRSRNRFEVFCKCEGLLCTARKHLAEPARF